MNECFRDNSSDHIGCHNRQLCTRCASATQSINGAIDGGSGPSCKAYGPKLSPFVWYPFSRKTRKKKESSKTRKSTS